MKLTEEEKLKRISTLLETYEGTRILANLMAFPHRKTCILEYSDKYIVYNEDNKSILYDGKYFLINEIGVKRI